MSDELLQIGERWHSEHCREKYNECVKHIQEIQHQARVQCEPWIKLAADYRSMGSAPFIILKDKA